MFHACNAQILNYVFQTKRIVVEISTRRGNDKVFKTENKKNSDNSGDSRIKGLIDSL